MTIFLVGCTGVPKGVTPVTGFDVERYLGTWYEVARLDHSFERGMTNVTATYLKNEDGTIGVVNRGYKTDNCRFEEAEGTARFQGDPSVASLSVTFFWPFAGGYHVFALDQQDYQYAMVAGPSRKYLWILSRSAELDTQVRDALIAEARRLEFPVEDLIFVSHAAPQCGSEG